MATLSSIKAWRIPWTEEPGELQSMGLQRAEHDWMTNIHTHTRECVYVCMCVFVCIWIWAFPGGSTVKNPPAHAGDAGSIPGSERSLGRGNGNPLPGKSHGQRSLVHGIAKSQIQLSNWACMHTYICIYSFSDSFPGYSLPLLKHFCHSFHLYICICLYDCIYINAFACMYMHISIWK